jgi:hypothetical protein
LAVVTTARRTLVSAVRVSPNRAITCLRERGLPAATDAASAARAADSAATAAGAARALEEALAIYRDLGDRGGEAETLNHAGTLHRARGDLDQAGACH